MSTLAAVIVALAMAALFTLCLGALLAIGALARRAKAAEDRLAAAEQRLNSHATVFAAYEETRKRIAEQMNACAVKLDELDRLLSLRFQARPPGSPGGPSLN